MSKPVFWAWKYGGKGNFMFFRGVEKAWKRNFFNLFSTVVWGKRKTFAQSESFKKL